jgi:hypothetical protein
MNVNRLYRHFLFNISISFAGASGLKGNAGFIVSYEKNYSNIVFLCFKGIFPYLEF